MFSKNWFLLWMICFPGCHSAQEKPSITASASITLLPEKVSGIPLPDGYTRKQYDKQSFASWLRNQPLKKDKTVYLYDGRKKVNQSAQYAVLDIPVGNRDLQQCADAVMRIRASWLYDQKQFDKILFFDNEGKSYPFSEPYTFDHFDAYLQKVFGMCGSASLSKQLNTVASVNDIEPGDVWIRGGFPGHAVLVMDVAVNSSGEKIFMISQSFMPAQDIHILINPLDAHAGPWFKAIPGKELLTPEYVFRPNELKRW